LDINRFNIPLTPGIVPRRNRSVGKGSDGLPLLRKHDDRRYRLLAATLIIASILLSPSLLLGQAYFGTVSGVLTDTSGAVLAHANVVLTDQQKGFTFKTTTDGNGSYLFGRFRRGCIR